MMYGVADTASLHFATAANKIGNVLDEQLENFIKEHPDTKLVIIDTMQKIKEAGGEAYSYASDYEIIGRLKRFADRHSICIVTVHHTRKQPAGDSFETISGTTGLLGCADGALLMQKKKRTALEATVDAANKLIAKLKAEIDSLKQEISDYKSVHSKLRAAELERENTELRGKVRSYEDVIQRNNLWRFFHPLREKAVTRDEAR